jgi:hypothetical protein
MQLEFEHTGVVDIDIRIVHPTFEDPVQVKYYRQPSLQVGEVAEILLPIVCAPTVPL